MMTKAELVKELNLIFDSVDRVQDAFPKTVGRPHQRLNAIRDQLALLALDVGLPLKPLDPATGKATDVASEKPEGSQAG